MQYGICNIEIEWGTSRHASRARCSCAVCCPTYLPLCQPPRWLELVVVYHSAVRLVFCWVCALGWATYPATYAPPIRLGLDVVVDILLEVPSQPVGGWGSGLGAGVVCVCGKAAGACRVMVSCYERYCMLLTDSSLPLQADLALALKQRLPHVCGC
jgi:hypothetical protein